MGGVLATLGRFTESLDVLDRLFAEFCRARGSSTWASRELPALRAWVDSLR